MIESLTLSEFVNAVSYGWSYGLAFSVGLVLIAFVSRSS